ncbi:hypothetical protein MKX03_016357, partial [Papaver bracteatum]
KMVVTLRQSLFKHTSRLALKEINLKFINTSSKFGHGRFQTTKRRRSTLGASRLKFRRIFKYFEQQICSSQVDPSSYP